MTTKHNAPQLKEAVSKAISDYTSLARRTDKARTGVVDLAIANGFIATDFISPGKADSTATKETWDFLKSAVVAGFTQDVRDLLAKPTTAGLSDKAKSDRRYWQQQIGARMSDLKAAMKRREEAGQPGAGGSHRSPFQVIDEQVGKWEKRLDGLVEGMSDAQAKAFRAAVAEFHKAVRAAAKAKA